MPLHCWGGRLLLIDTLYGSVYLFGAFSSSITSMASWGVASFRDSVLRAVWFLFSISVGASWLSALSS